MRRAILLMPILLASISPVRASYLYAFSSASDALPEPGGSQGFSFDYSSPSLLSTTTEFSQSELQDVVLPPGYHILVAAFEDPFNEGQYPFQPAIAFSFDQAPDVGGGVLEGFELDYPQAFTAPGVYNDGFGDVLTITSVPEPPAFLPAAGCLLFLGMARWRRSAGRRSPIQPSRLRFAFDPAGPSPAGSPPALPALHAAMLP